MKPLPGSAGVSPARTPHGEGWHSRGYLPHFDKPGLSQMITFRLADSVPLAKFAELHERSRHDLAGEGRPNAPQSRSADAERRKRLEACLNVGHGACYLRDRRIARLVESALLHGDGTYYHLLAWVIMPNHVHVLIETLAGSSLSDIVQAWKSFTAKEANRMLGRSGRFWQPDYFDRAIRDERHLHAAVEYVHNNPVKAGLVSRPEDWVYSSARRAAG